jgi:hypothetical protein
MAVREATNRIKREIFRVSRVPINPAETIFQGDLICWDAAAKRASKAGSASGATFMGISDTTNPVETAGSPTFLSSTTNPRINVVQKGLVEVIWGAAETIFPYDTAVIGADAQTCIKGASNPVGVVDVDYPSAGKAVAIGDIVRIWLKPAATYAVV